MRMKLRSLQILIVSFLTNFLFFVSYSKADIFYKHGDRISKNTQWDGSIFINGTLYIDKDVLLKINPGTKIFFKRFDIDKDGVSESSIISSGIIHAVGEKNNPILFSSFERDKKWGDWKEIQINHAKNIRFEYCIFEYGEYALHIHFSEGVIKNNIFRFNADGTRIGNSKLEIKNNLFENNVGKALNFTNSKLFVSENTIRNNRDGLFVFEKTGETVITRNNIYDNYSNVKVGDFFQGKLIMGETFINKISDLQKEIIIEVKKDPFLNAMPDFRDAYVLFQIDTSGFVDGGGSIANEVAYIPSFDGHIYEVNLNSGKYSKISVDDFTDARPAVDENALYAVTWGGVIRAIDISTKKLIWEDNFRKSLKDDHRMASPLIYKKFLIAVSQGGHLKIFEKSTGKIIFQQFLDGEFRASPFILDNEFFLVSTAGEIYKISLENFSIKAKKFDNKFYSSPIFYKGLIYVLGSDGELISFDRDLNVQERLKVKGNFRYQSPVVFKGKLVLCSLDGYIIEIALDGKVYYKKTRYIFSATPTVYNDLFIVLPTFQGDLVMFDGNKIFSIGNFGEIQFSPEFYKEKLVFGTRDNKIYVIKLW